MFLKKHPGFYLLLIVSMLTGLLLFAYAGNSIAATAPAGTIYNARDTTITDTILNSCSRSKEVEKIIDDAIAMGAPIYNAGAPLACYRIYEGAAYKILYEYGKTCREVEKVLKAAVDKSHGDYSDIEKAWIMRAAFDKILGVPTQTKASTPDRVG